MMTFRKTKQSSLYISDRPLTRHECNTLLDMNNASLTFRQAKLITSILSTSIMNKSFSISIDKNSSPSVDLPSKSLLISEGIINAHHKNPTNKIKVMQKPVYITLYGTHLEWLKDIILTN